MLVALGCGIPAWLVGQQELKKFKAGVYSGRGKGEITAGYIFGILGVVLSLLSIVAFIVLIVLGISLGATTQACSRMRLRKQPRIEKGMPANHGPQQKLFDPRRVSCPHWNP